MSNSTDDTRGEPLAIRAQKRQSELRDLLAALPEDALRERNDVEVAISVADELLTGDNAHLAESTAAGINRWLENTKHLGEVTPTAPIAQ